MPKIELNNLKEKKMSRLFCFLIFIFILPGFIHSQQQYRLLSWTGDVKIRTANRVIQPSPSPGGLSLRDCDAILIPEEGEISIRFPGGTEKRFHGPRFTTVKTLENEVPERPVNIIERFLEISGVTELFDRECEEAIGATRGGKDNDSVYRQIYRLKESADKDKVLSDMELQPNVRQQLECALDLVECHFDAFSAEERLFMKARIYEHFNQYRTALNTVFDQYQQLLREQEQKKKERKSMEALMFRLLRPIDIHFSVNNPVVQDGNREVSMTFQSNFALWWIAFPYHNGELEVIKRSYDYKPKPQATFEISCNIKSHQGTEPFYVFVIAFVNGYESRTFDDKTATKTVLLDKNILESTPGTVCGFSRVIIKIRLQ